VTTRAETVCAVVVTYNRSELLAECLERLHAQTRPADHVLVIDNASTDETPRVLAADDGIEVLRLAENRGSSGGFAAGVERAHEQGYDWLWLLDDDTFTEPGCLEALLDGARRAPHPPQVLASYVLWKDDTEHPMNRVWPRGSSTSRRPPLTHWRDEYVAAQQVGLILIRSATFVSVLVHRGAIDAHGYPPAHYFIWHDDTRFFGRILRDAYGYVVPESIARHWTPKPYNTITDARGRFYYKVRNRLWVLKSDSFKGIERYYMIRAIIRAIRLYIRDSEDTKAAVRVVLRGVRDGMRREPG
jgi:rhamnopyranosyl-N-acetylglucosaminyl-diphospho-decaprenol beta-1,3/1,4-galactofuranosyltransferase